MLSDAKLSDMNIVWYYFLSQYQYNYVSVTAEQAYNDKK
jgi:hypothetical protein